ncbi:MAG: DUF86 domain-containing protein [Magnetospirillum sp. WYHS-4]
MTRDFSAYLRDMLEYGRLAEKFVEGMKLQDFLDDSKTQFAVTRALDVIGEAARKVPADLRDRYPKIPWRRIVAMRNILAHDYLGIRADRVFETVTVFVPELDRELAAALKEIEVA